MKPILLRLIDSHPFVRMDHENPYTHLSTFMEMCSIMEMCNIIRAFTFSLAGKAKTWLQSHLNKSLNTQEEVEEKFIARFFPLSRFIKAKSSVATFFPRV